MSGAVVDIPLVHALYELYGDWHALQLKFPKSQRYSLGQKVGDMLLVTLEYVLEAAAEREPTKKRDSVVHASVKVDALKLLVRLAKDCKRITHQHYQTLESKLLQAGKMLGGWNKSLR